MRIRQAIYTLFSFLIISMIPGCEKVINVDLNEAAPRIVIEGLITDRRGPYTITMSKSGSYFNQPSLETVSGAVAVITDNTGVVDSLHEASPGIYRTVRLRGIPGREYTLKVISDGQEYTGTSIMMSRVNIDSIVLVKNQFERFDLKGHSHNEIQLDIHCFFIDAPEKNYYRVKVFKNDSINTQSYKLFDDQYTNGELTDLRVGRATTGDIYRIELMSLDKSTYTYYHTLAQLIYQNPFFGSTPANPNNNLSNGALGYFGTASVSTNTIVITDAMINGVK